MKQNLPLKIVVSALGLGGACLHIWKPDLRIDSITIVLSVIAILPWLQPLIKSIELLGVKLELQDIQNRLNEVRATVADTKNETRELATIVVGGDAVPTEASDGTRYLTPEELETVHRLAKKGQFRFRKLGVLADELSMSSDSLLPILAALYRQRIVSPVARTDEARLAISNNGGPESLWHIPSAESLPPLALKSK